MIMGLPFASRKMRTMLRTKYAGIPLSAPPKRKNVIGKRTFPSIISVTQLPSIWRAKRLHT